MSESAMSTLVYPIRADSSGLTTVVARHLATTADITSKLSVLGQYSRDNDATGGYIQFLPENSFCPTLAGREGKQVFLFRFVEVLDELIDYDKIREQLPLSYRQIGRAISFLRKLSQFNCAVDIDDLMDLAEAEDETFITTLRSALSSQGANIVLNIP